MEAYPSKLCLGFRGGGLHCQFRVELLIIQMQRFARRYLIRRLYASTPIYDAIFFEDNTLYACHKCAREAVAVAHAVVKLQQYSATKSSDGETSDAFALTVKICLFFARNCW